MDNITESQVLKNSKAKLSKLIEEHNLQDTDISVLVKTLTPEEAIGEPGRRDFPIILGKERVIEAQLLTTKAHAFTDSPGEFIGKLSDCVNIPLTSNKNRAIYIAVMNAVLRYLNITDKTIHCKDNDPELCAAEIAETILNKFGKIKVGLIGLNPAIAEMLVKTFNKENILITDLNRQNINTSKFGVQIWDGKTKTEELIMHSDVIVFTGTTIINGAFDTILDFIQKYRKDYYVFGVTGAGICSLMHYNRICPYGRDS